MTSDRESVEKRHRDQIAALTEKLEEVERKLQENTLLVAVNVDVARRAALLIQRVTEILAQTIGQAPGRPLGPSAKQLGTCGVQPENPHPFDADACVGWTPAAPEPNREQIENDRMERRGGR